jgi:uncharacterized protein YoxC
LQKVPIEPPTKVSPASPPGESPEQRALVSLETALTSFVSTFERSARRWEMLVYPSVLVFGILGLSGFYLIYSVTQDMHALSRAMDPRMGEHMDIMTLDIREMTATIQQFRQDVVVMVEHVDTITQHMGEMRGDIRSMNASIASMSEDMDDMARKLASLEPMLANIAGMNQAIQAMTANTGVMTRDMGIMNQNVSRPMSFMNSFAPW